MGTVRYDRSVSKELEADAAVIAIQVVLVVKNRGLFFIFGIVLYFNLLQRRTLLTVHVVQSQAKRVSRFPLFIKAPRDLHLLPLGAKGL